MPQVTGLPILILDMDPEVAFNLAQHLSAMVWVQILPTKMPTRIPIQQSPSPVELGSNIDSQTALEFSSNSTVTVWEWSFLPKDPLESIFLLPPESDLLSSVWLWLLKWPHDLAPAPWSCSPGTVLFTQESGWRHACLCLRRQVYQPLYNRRSWSSHITWLQTLRAAHQNSSACPGAQ